MDILSQLRSLFHAPLARGRLCVWAAAVLLVLVGIFVRTVPWSKFNSVGFDEVVYRTYVVGLDHVGLDHYPEICQLYTEQQKQPGARNKLPPTRFLYIYCGWVAKRIAFGDAPPLSIQAPGFAQSDPALVSLHRASSFFLSLMLLAAGICAWRMFGAVRGLGVLALMVFSPLQIHMAQHAFIDGFFAAWATLCVWLLWENLRRPDHGGWLAAYGVCLAAMVMTKENAFFVYVGLCGLLAVNRWARFGVITRRLLCVMVAGPLAGVAVLVYLAGSVDVFFEMFRLYVVGGVKLPYAIATQDGPWYRYLIDLMLINPLVLCLAIGGLFTCAKTSRPLLYLSAFAGFTYLVMCNVRYGMNLRFATIWELPLCALAAAQVDAMSRAFGKRSALVGAFLLAALCAYSLRQYVILFVDNSVYDIVSEPLLRAVKILK